MVDIDMEPVFDAVAKIKVIGVGGAGGNAVNRMIEEGLEGVEFISINTDAAALEANKATKRIQIGEKLTRGLGAGANPDVGRAAMEENREEISRELMDTDMVFITAGMGGGTGTGAAPVVAEIAKQHGILTVAIVTKPFLFEGKVRDRNAQNGIAELRKHVDTIIIIQNQKLLSIVAKGTPLLESFKTADGVLNDATKGISKLITECGVHVVVNVDFADVKAIMTDMGDALMGIGESDDPENRAIVAAEAAINSPLLEDIDIAGAKGLLVNFTGGPDLALDEVSLASERINEAVGLESETNIIFGAVIDPDMTGRIQVTVVATGFNRDEIDHTYGAAKKTSNVVQQAMGQRPREKAPAPAVVRTPSQPRTPMAEELPPVVDVPVEDEFAPSQQGYTEQMAPVQNQPQYTDTIQSTPRPAMPNQHVVPTAPEQQWQQPHPQQQVQQPMQEDNRVISREHRYERPHGTARNAGMGNSGGEVDREIPAFLRQQMQ